jgi:hypothetical protein
MYHFHVIPCALPVHVVAFSIYVSRYYVLKSTPTRQPLSSPHLFTVTSLRPPLSRPASSKVSTSHIGPILTFLLSPLYPHNISHSASPQYCVSHFQADIQRRGSIKRWTTILSVYGADTIAIDLSLSALSSWFMQLIIGFWNNSNVHAIISTLLIISLHWV